MDGLKLAKWRENFNQGIPHLQIEFDSFFKGKKLNDYFELKLDELNENLCLKITDDTIPGELKRQLEKLFNDSRPEDSV